MTIKLTPPLVVDDPRMGGNVKRWHTWPMIQQQSVAEHSWNVARILLAIWPDARGQVVVQAMFHDVEEVRTGDPPSRVKADDPELQLRYHEMEADTRNTMCNRFALPRDMHDELSMVERWILKLADIAEMWEFCLQEMTLGNKFALGPRDRAGEALEKFLKVQIPHHEETQRVVARNLSVYMARRSGSWMW